MRLSLSKKEVAEIHLMLTTLPIPPIPLVVVLDSSKIVDQELKTAFEMATAPIVSDSLRQDGIVNAHSVIAAMSFFNKWSASSTCSEGVARQCQIQHKKDACLLRIIASVLDYNAGTQDSPSATKDDDVLQIFVTASQEWINTYLPESICITVSAAPKNKTIGFEHDMHISMAHYCYAQGVLYSSKNSRLKCSVHDALYNNYVQVVKEATDEETGTTPEEMHEHIEIAKMYSQFPFHKMLLLCFDRLLTDCLYGHTLEVPGNDVEQNARDLLRVSVGNYESMMAQTGMQCAVKASTDTITKTPPVDLVVAPQALSTPLLGTVGVVEHKVCASPTSLQVLEVEKQECVSGIGSYNSYIGIFTIGIVNFLQNSDPYSVCNMRTSLRHLSELVICENHMIKQACALINMAALLQLVRKELLKNPCHRDIKEEIEEILFELEQNLSRTPDTLDTPAATETLDTPAATETLDTPAATETLDTSAATETLDTPAATETLDTPAATETLDTPAATETLDTSAATETLDTPAIVQTNASGIVQVNITPTASENAAVRMQGG